MTENLLKRLDRLAEHPEVRSHAYIFLIKNLLDALEDIRILKNSGKNASLGIIATQAIKETDDFTKGLEK